MRFNLCMLVINVTLTQNGCKSVKPIFRNYQTNYISFKLHSLPEVVAGNCLIVLTLGLNCFVSHMTRKVGSSRWSGNFWEVLRVSDWPRKV